MRQLIYSILLSSLTVFSSGCTSPYLVDRGRDAMDIFTVSVGTGAGAKARVGPVQTGIMYQEDYYGLRGGGFGAFGGSHSFFYNHNYDAQFLFSGSESYQPVDIDVIAKRNKEFSTSEAMLQIPIPLVSYLAKNSYCPSYYTQIDIVAALGGSIRLGFNPGELVDFVLGWVRIDIYSDDIEELLAKKEAIKPQKKKDSDLGN